MSESNQNWSSPWRTLQQLLADQFGAMHAGESREPARGDEAAMDDGAIGAPSWLKRARLRQFQPHPSRQ
jgi:hypothetical protein